MIVNLISLDKEILPDALAGFAASAALACSDIPFGGPVSEVRVGRINGEYVINPTRSAMEQSDMDMIIAGTVDNIMMVEGEMKEVSEKICSAPSSLVMKPSAGNVNCCSVCSQNWVRTPNVPTATKYMMALRDTIMSNLREKVKAVAYGGTAKQERSDAFKAIITEYIETMSEEERAEKEGPQTLLPRPGMGSHA